MTCPRSPTDFLLPFSCFPILRATWNSWFYATMATLEQLLEGPGLEPPPGVLPNFVHPQSQTGANLACNILCLTLATICVAIRLYTRFVITHSHGWEDCEFCRWLEQRLWRLTYCL